VSSISCHMQRFGATSSRSASTSCASRALLFCFTPPTKRSQPHTCGVLCPRLAFTGQIASLVGWSHPASVLSASASASLFLFCCAGLASGSVMWQYRRHTRKTLMLLQVALSCGVEALVVNNKALAAVIGAVKVLAFQWFALFARYDAPRSSGLVVPGVWTDHDNFHVMVRGTVRHAIPPARSLTRMAHPRRRSRTSSR